MTIARHFGTELTATLPCLWDAMVGYLKGVCDGQERSLGTSLDGVFLYIADYSLNLSWPKLLGFYGGNMLEGSLSV